MIEAGAITGENHVSGKAIVDGTDWINVLTKADVGAHSGTGVTQTDAGTGETKTVTGKAATTVELGTTEIVAIIITDESNGIVAINDNETTLINEAGATTGENHVSGKAIVDGTEAAKLF